jgi:hypothetical protein
MKTTVVLRSVSAGKMVLSAVRRASPYAIALSAVFEAYGYFFDKSSNEIRLPDNVVSKSDFKSISFLCDHGSQVGYYFADNKPYYGYSVFGSIDYPPAGDYLVINNCGDAGVKFLVYNSFSKFGDETPSSISIPSSKRASIEEMGDLFLNEQLPLFQKIINEAVSSGAYKENWPELVERENSIRTAFEDIDLNADLQSDTKGITNDTKKLEDTRGSFCEWAPEICKFIDFVMGPSKEPAIPGLPVEKVSPVKWASGLPTGVCPSIPPISFQGQSIAYDLTNACWAASSVFKPILIAMSLITAAFILAGVKL